MLIIRLVFLLGLLLPLSLRANPIAGAPTNEELASSLGLAVERAPLIRFRAIQKSGQNAVMLSETGRYMIKGPFQDMWDGVQQDTSTKLAYPKVPSSIDINDYTIRFGTPGKQTLFLVTSYSCFYCASAMEQLFTEENLTKYDIRVLPVYNKKSDAQKIQAVFCSDDRREAFKRVFVQRESVQQSNGCDERSYVINNGLAKLFRVPTLPTTFVEGTGLAFFGHIAF